MRAIKQTSKQAREQAGGTDGDHIQLGDYEPCIVKLFINLRYAYTISYANEFLFQENRSLQEGPKTSIASLQDELTAVKLREAEANLSLKGNWIHFAETNLSLKGNWIHLAEDYLSY